MYRSRTRAVILSECLLLWFNPAIAADTASNFLSISGGFSRGDFATGENTDLYRMQIGYGQISGRYDFSITVPYLLLQDSTANESGLGDISLQAGMTFDEDVIAGNSFYGSVSLKLPTADETRALGTGETDIGGMLGYTGRFNTLSLILVGGYIITGDAPAQSYNDVFVYSAGLAMYSNPWYVYGRLDGQQKIIDTEDDALELTGGLFYQIKTRQYLTAEVFAGLSDTSPDIGFNLGLVNWF
jgi:hypothetical protein